MSWGNLLVAVYGLLALATGVCWGRLIERRRRLLSTDGGEQ